MRAPLTFGDLPGRAVFNPLGEEPWVLNVTAVSGPGPDGLATVSALEGEVVCCPLLDWDALEFTPAVAELAAFVVAAEAAAGPGEFLDDPTRNST